MTCGLARLLTFAAGLLARTPRLLGALAATGAGAALWHALATPQPPVTTGSHLGALVSALLARVRHAAVRRPGRTCRPGAVEER